LRIKDPQRNDRSYRKKRKGSPGDGNREIEEAGDKSEAQRKYQHKYYGNSNWDNKEFESPGKVFNPDV
jgi:hypothetical protein